MTFSATIPVTQIDTANATLESLGYGPNNFSVPLRTGVEEATHVGLHCIAEWPAFKAAVASIPNVQITEGPLLTVTFGDHCSTRALEWSDPTYWFQDPVMIGEQRTYGGKLWESLVDYNVWTPPVAWREVVSQGYPAWVQPTGAHDAYTLGFRVSHNNQNWENTGSNANVWEPGVFGWTVI